MKRRDIALPGLVVLAGLFIGAYLLAPLISPSLIARAPPILLPLLYYSGLPILSLAGAGFVFTWYRGRIKDDWHRDEILKIINTPVSSVGEVEYSGNLAGEAIIQRPLSWTESDPLYPYCLAHLQNYADTLALLESARKYSDEQRAKIIQEFQAVDQIIDQRLTSFNALPAVDAPLEKSKPYYVKRLARYAIFTHAQNPQGKTAPGDLQVVKLQEGKRKTNQLIRGSDVIAVGSLANLKKLISIIRKSVSDPEVKDATGKIQESERLLKTNPMLQDFEAKRTQIAFALSAGRHKLPGHCERCP